MTTATITFVSGPVLKARAEQPFQMGEAVRVGERELMGEVIRIQGQEIVVQVYEDTSGLRPGAAVLGNGVPLAVRVGPHLLGGIFDGLLRPLMGADSAYIEPGTVKTPPHVLPFEPGVKKGDTLNAGMRFGDVQTAGGKTLQCLAWSHPESAARWRACRPAASMPRTRRCAGWTTPMARPPNLP